MKQIDATRCFEQILEALPLKIATVRLFASHQHSV